LKKENADKEKTPRLILTQADSKNQFRWTGFDSVRGLAVVSPGKLCLLSDKGFGVNA